MERPRLSRLESAQTWIVRSTHTTVPLNRMFRSFQREVGARWIVAGVKNQLHVHGLEHVRPYRRTPILLVANHRSFFDMFVINAVLYRRAGFDQRFLFPVRAHFFYDSLLGLVVNGVISFFSMYPPIFRDRRRSLNLESWQELATLLTEGGRSAGLHPEGTRNRGPDPYALLPVHSGVGRLVHATGVPVLPAFINGLSNHALDQIWRNLRHLGPPVNLVFGPELDLTALRSMPPRGRTYKAIAEEVGRGIAQLAEVERSLRCGSNEPP